MIFFEQSLVDARTIVKAFGGGKRRKLNQIAIALVVFGKQYQMKIFVLVVLVAVSVGFGRDVDLATDNRLDTAFDSRLVEIYDAVHCAVVGYRD